MKLISMTDFVLNVEKNNAGQKDEYIIIDWQNKCIEFDRIMKYANFLKQPLKLGMFIPCDENTDILEIPIDIYYKPDFNCQKFPQECYPSDIENYDLAINEVLFKGFSIEEHQLNNYSVREENNILNVMWKFENENWRPANGIKTLEDLVQFNLDLSDTVSF